MSKKQKIWIFVLIWFLLMDIIAHFTLGDGASACSIHINYMSHII